MNPDLRHVGLLALDKKLRKFRGLQFIERPRRGWIKAIREGLGMTAAQLARRMDVQTPRVYEIENSELTGGITLATMQRAADALGCKFVYGLVPVDAASLEQIRQARARTVAEDKLERIDHTMALEDQVAHDRPQALRRAELVEWLLRNDRQLWTEDAPKKLTKRRTGS